MPAKRDDDDNGITKDKISRARGSPYAKMIAAKPICREEGEFIKAFANVLNHATAVIAANPEKSFPAGGIAERIREAYSGFRPDQRDAIQRRARARLSGSIEQRRRDFGPYADRGAEVWSHDEPRLDVEMRRQLKQAVWARLDTQRDEINEFLTVSVAAKPLGGKKPAIRTWVEVGFFTGDVLGSWKKQTINYPIEIQLRWETKEIGAERGVWQLLRAGQSGQQELVLASGHAGDAPGGIFSIDLAKYLPSQPPAVPASYLIRVTPGTKPKTSSAKGEIGVAIPGKAVGSPSDPVVITYSSFFTPPVTFQIFDIYRRAEFHLESIHMVEDQVGPGSEEFHTAGFVQMSFPASSTQAGAQQRFGPFYAVLDPSGPRTKDFGWEAYFYLNNPDTHDWPVAFTLVVSVLEEDDGGSLSGWQSSLWTVADQMVNSEIGQDIRDYLEKNFKEYIGDNLVQIVEAGGEIAEYLGALISSTMAGIVGMVIAAVTLVLSDIISGMKDDYYGTEAFVFVLPTNITDLVHSLPGKITSDGGFELERETIELKGYSSWPDAAAFDGIVDITFHWKLTNRQTFSPVGPN
jgi:hypothetical protein